MGVGNPLSLCYHRTMTRTASMMPTTKNILTTTTGLTQLTLQTVNVNISSMSWDKEIATQVEKNTPNLDALNILGAKQSTSDEWCYVATEFSGSAVNPRNDCPDAVESNIFPGR